MIVSSGPNLHGFGCYGAPLPIETIIHLKSSGCVEWQTLETPTGKPPKRWIAPGTLEAK